MTDAMEATRPAVVTAGSEQPATTDPKSEARRALLVLHRAVEECPFEDEDEKGALKILCAHLGYEMAPDEEDSDPTVEAGEMDEALARARTGNLIDCCIHLGRGLPSEYRGIADALERALGGVQ